MENFLFSIPTRVYFGRESYTRLGQILHETGRRNLIITESIFANERFLKKITDHLEKQGIGSVIYSEIGMKSTSTSIETIIPLIRAGKIQTVIGLGGVRCLSIAKTAAAVSNQTEKIDNYLNVAELTAPPLNYIEIPTSCRNPVMLTEYAVNIDGKNRDLRMTRIKDFRPYCVIMDPDLNEHIPIKYAYATLMDCLMQAIEGYLSETNNFFSETIFLKSIGTLTSVLKTPRSELSSPEIRVNLYRAGFLCALGLTMGSPGIGSAVSMILGAKFMQPKSLLATIMMPHVLNYGLKNCPEKLARIAPILDVKTENISVRETAEQVVELVRYMIGMENLPMRLKDLDIGVSQIDQVLPIVENFPFLHALPVRYSRDELFNLLEVAL